MQYPVIKLGQSRAVHAKILYSSEAELNSCSCSREQYDCNVDNAETELETKFANSEYNIELELDKGFVFKL